MKKNLLKAFSKESKHILSQRASSIRVDPDTTSRKTIEIETSCACTLIPVLSGIEL